MNRPTNSIVGFAGAIGSGKTTLSRLAAQKLDVPRASFGDLVRLTATQRGLALTRESLQDLGDSMIAEGWRPFCAALLAQAGWQSGRGLVIDGVRHVEAVSTLGALVNPCRFVLVFVDLPDDVRHQRLSERGVAVSAQLSADSHPNEAQVSLIRGMADVIVDNSLPASCVVTGLLDQLQLTRHPD